MLEQNERKKFRTNSVRQGGRSRKRTDSYPETSETNTPGKVTVEYLLRKNEGMNNTNTWIRQETRIESSFSERVASPPIPSLSESNNVTSLSDTTTLGSQTSVTICPSNNQIGANNKNKLATSIKKNNSVDCDNSPITENILAEEVSIGSVLSFVHNSEMYNGTSLWMGQKQKYFQWIVYGE